MSEEEIVRLLIRFNDYLTQGDLLWNMLRPFGLWIAKGLALVLDGLSGVLGDMIKLLDIFNNDDFQQLIQDLGPLKWGLLLVVISVFGLLLMFNKIKNPGESFGNLFLILLLTISLPFIFSTASDFASGMFESIYSKSDKPGTSIILENTTDMKLVAEEGWQLKLGEIRNNYEDVRQINMTEKLEDPGSIENGEPLDRMLITGSDGKDSLEKIPEPSGVAEFLAKGTFSQKYYRNKVRFMNIYLTQIVMIIALAVTSFKFAIIIIKMLMDYVLLISAGLADITNGQRVKALFSEILASFALIVYIPVILQVYMIASSVIASMNLNFFSYIIAMAGAAWALMDGPNGFQRVTGVDAGLSSTGAVIMGVMGGSKLVSSLTSAATTAAKSAGSALREIGAFGAGFVMSGNDSDNGTQDNFGINDSLDDKTEKDAKGPQGFNEMESEEQQDVNNTNDEDLQNANKDEVDSDETTFSDSNQENDESVDDQSQTIHNEEDSANGVNGEEDNQGEEDQSKELENADSINDEKSDNNSGKDSVNGELPKKDTEGNMQEEINRNNQSDESRVNGLNEGSIGEPEKISSDAGKEVADKEPQSATPEVGPSPNNEVKQKQEELDELKRSNPAKEHLKNRTLGYDSNDPRRYHPQTTVEKTKESYSAGKNYRRYLEQKKKTKSALKDLNKKKD